jgi:hypothetical protein
MATALNTQRHPGRPSNLILRKSMKFASLTARFVSAQKLWITNDVGTRKSVTHHTPHVGRSPKRMLKPPTMMRRPDAMTMVCGAGTPLAPAWTVKTGAWRKCSSTEISKIPPKRIRPARNR